MGSNTLTRATWTAVACLFLVITVAPATPSQAQGRNRAGLVIQYGEGGVWTACVAFDEPEITGLELLSRAGLEVVRASSGVGEMVCQIGDVGCSNPNQCLCACTGAMCVYWSYWHLVDGTWQYAVRGGGSYRVQPGAVDGWVWGPGSVTQAPQPPLVTFDELCAPPSPTVPPTPVQRTSPLSTATVTLPATEPGATATPTVGQQPSSTPVQAPVTPQPAEPTVTPAAPGGDAEPSPAPVEEPPARPLDYLAFGAIIVALVVTGALMAFRRKRGRP